MFGDYEVFDEEEEVVFLKKNVLEIEEYRSFLRGLGFVFLFFLVGGFKFRFIGKNLYDEFVFKGSDLFF